MIVRALYKRVHITVNVVNLVIKCTLLQYKTVEMFVVSESNASSKNTIFFYIKGRVKFGFKTAKNPRMV